MVEVASLGRVTLRRAFTPSSGLAYTIPTACTREDAGIAVSHSVGSLSRTHLLTLVSSSSFVSPGAVPKKQQEELMRAIDEMQVRENAPNGRRTHVRVPTRARSRSLHAHAPGAGLAADVQYVGREVFQGVCPGFQK